LSEGATNRSDLPCRGLIYDLIYDLIYLCLAFVNILIFKLFFYRKIKQPSE